MLLGNIEHFLKKQIWKIRIFWNELTETELDLATRDSYFAIRVEVFTSHILAKNIFHESYRANRTQYYGLKTFK